jgi:hypothetical protein
MPIARHWRGVSGWCARSFLSVGGARAGAAASPPLGEVRRSVAQNMTEIGDGTQYRCRRGADRLESDDAITERQRYGAPAVT